MDPGRENLEQFSREDLKGAFPCVPKGTSGFPKSHPYVALRETPTFPEHVATSVGFYPSVSTPAGVLGMDNLPTGDFGRSDAGPWPHTPDGQPAAPACPWGVSSVSEFCSLAKWLFRSVGCTPVCPFRCARLAGHRSGPFPEPAPARSAPLLQPLGSRSRNRCHGERRVAVLDPTGGPGPVLDQNWGAFERLKHSRGALWTDGMASIVEHSLRHNWDFAPRPGESRGMWDMRVDATYDHHYSGMVQWLNKPLQAAQGPGQGQREHNPPNSEKPPEEWGWHQPQERPRDHHGGGSGYQNGGQGWSSLAAQEWGTGVLAKAYRRTRTDEPTNGTATDGSSGGPRGPRMVQGVQETLSPA